MKNKLKAKDMIQKDWDKLRKFAKVKKDKIGKRGHNKSSGQVMSVPNVEDRAEIDHNSYMGNNIYG